MPWVRKILSYAAAVLLTTALACAFSSHFVLWALSVDLGVEIGVGRWLATIAGDVLGMGPLYGVVVAVAFCIALPVAALVVGMLRRAGVAWLGLRPLGFGTGGAAAMLAALFIIRLLVEELPVAGARTPLGLAAQALAGAVGGCLFAWLTNRAQGESKPSAQVRR